MYAGCRNQRPNVSTYEAGWITNHTAIGNATAAAAMAAGNVLRTLSRRARPRAVTAVMPAMTPRNGPDGCAYAHATSAAAAAASDQREPVSAKLLTASRESRSGGMTHTPSSA